MLPVSQDDISDVSDSETIHKDRPGMHLICHSCRLLIHLQYVSMGEPPHSYIPSISSSSTGPSTSSSMAGRMSVPVGTIIFTGAFATRSSTCAR